MEPPSEEFYPQQRQHPWESSHKHQQQLDDDEREFSRQQSSSSRGRSSNRYQTTAPAPSGSKLNTHQVASRPSSHSTSNTPRRKGNPQSCSPSMASKSRSPNKYHHTNHDHNNISHYSSTSNNSIDESLSSTASPQLTPLSTLSTILTTHASHSHTSLQLYRQSHALHRHATERKTAAIEKLRLAQAELEHATTAQEYAAEELSQSTIQKNEAQAALNSICKQIRHQSKPFINRRVKLVGLNKNAMWNGRLGTVMKLVTDGSSEDVGRWKVKLDPEWRGRDADGKRLARCDTMSLDNTHDCTPPKNNNDNGNGQQGEEGTAANSMNVVVAKAENLELIDNNVREEDERGDNEMFASNVQSSASRSSQKQQQQRKSRDPSIPRRSTNDPVAEITPESTPVKYNKSESDGRYHEKKKSESKDRQSVHPKHKQQQRNNTRSTSSSQQRQGPRQVSPSKKSQRPWQQQQQQQQQQSSPYISNKKSSSSTSRSPSTTINKNDKIKKNSSSSPQQYVTPIRRCPSNDSARLSSAFSAMLLSPVSFAPVSFQPEASDSFQQWVENDDNEQYHPQQYDERGYGRQHQQQSAGSFFDEVTSLEKNDFGEDGNYDSYKYYDNEWVNEEEEGHDPQLYYDPSTPGDTITTNTMNEQERLPNIVVLPVPEDDTESNPFLSPGYTSSSPPHCVGVQNAGVSHVNGVYLLAYPKDDQNNNGGPNNKDNTSPLYFRDSPPILLSDNRYYDMCILRIPCPDSAEHVIWFLARVDVDPNCLDVKFSDCYYYCRMLRNDDGMGGERDDGCHVPPSRGWNVPKIPPGVEMLSIGATCSASFSTSTSLGHHHDGLGIGPRPPTSVRVSGGENGDGEVMSEFVSPGMDSSKMSSKYSI